MLLRISCNRCCLSALWTDDPKWFLETVCNGGTQCEATLVADQFAVSIIAGMDGAPGVLPRPKSVVPPRQKYP